MSLAGKTAIVTGGGTGIGAAVAAYGAIDILVNNAGISGVGHIHTHSIETWDRVLAVNLRGPFLFCRVNTICPGMVVTEISQNTPGLDHAKCLYPEYD
jgi:NAD(P)-dependent dehydrogenase (short-subunit alcohol dehydrogenase family)